MTFNKAKDIESGEKWQNESVSAEVLEILEDKPEPVFIGMRKRVSDALSMEFHQESARWATDSVIEAVFGEEFANK